MLHADLRATLRAALDPDPKPVPAAGDRLAAVLAPLVETPEPSLVFTVRSLDMSRHPGQISFPGGLQELGETLAETALRETFEEIGLDRADVELVGALPSVHTVVSEILVVPFVGLLSATPEFTVSDAEIQAVLTFSVESLAAAEAIVEYERDGGGVWRGWAYELDGHTVWGATGFMLHALLDIMRKETSWLSRAP
jgi:8-oxo-dGTP pyrophosphatase MutT (NUDIX family)